MADIPASNWNEADASNSTAAPDGAPEGMFPSGVNDTMRAMMGATKRWYDWTIPLVTGGTSTAYTLAYAVAPGALVDGMNHVVQFNATCGASPTLNINALGALPLHIFAAGAWGVVPSGAITANMVCRVAYNASAGAYRLISAPAVLPSVITAALGSNVPLTLNTPADGPSVAQGTVGTWFVSGTVGLLDNGSANSSFTAKLWDGTTVIAEAATIVTALSSAGNIHLAGTITSPAGNLRITVTNSSGSTSAIVFNASGNSKSSVITAFRIA